MQVVRTTFQRQCRVATPRCRHSSCRLFSPSEFLRLFAPMFQDPDAVMLSVSAMPRALRNPREEMLVGRDHALTTPTMHRYTDTMFHPLRSECDAESTSIAARR